MENRSVQGSEKMGRLTRGRRLWIWKHDLGYAVLCHQHGSEHNQMLRMQGAMELPLNPQRFTPLRAVDLRSR